jgi:hypothetical protein
MSDLDKALAEALGQRVCGGAVVLRQSGITGAHGEWWGCTRCPSAWGAREDVALDHGPYPPYSTSWEAAGRLLGALEAKGLEWEWFKEGSRYMGNVQKPNGMGWPRVGSTALEALAKSARAALRALGREGEREQTRR